MWVVGTPDQSNTRSLTQWSRAAWLLASRRGGRECRTSARRGARACRCRHRDPRRSGAPVRRPRHSTAAAEALRLQERRQPPATAPAIIEGGRAGRRAALPSCRRSGARRDSYCSWAVCVCRDAPPVEIEIGAIDGLVWLMEVDAADPLSCAVTAALSWA